MARRTRQQGRQRQEQGAGQGGPVTSMQAKLPREMGSPRPRPPTPQAVSQHLGSRLPGNPMPAAQVGLPPPSPKPRAPVTCSRRDAHPPAHP